MRPDDFSESAADWRTQGELDELAAAAAERRITLTVEPAADDWQVRAEGASLGVADGMVVARAPDQEAAVRMALTNAHELEGQGFEVRAIITDAPTRPIAPGA